jgi:hypothetical protein
MATHDLTCTKCGTVYEDHDVHFSKIKDGEAFIPCVFCNDAGPLKIRYDGWDNIQLFNDGMGNTRHDRTGAIRSIGVQDDPLAKIELGMFKSAQDKSLKTFTDDQVLHFRERLAVEGDSRKLRDKIIETRQRNLGGPA